MDDPTLNSAAGLNEAVMSTTDEALLARMIDAEVAGKRRRVLLLRIHSRLNKVRAHRERRALLEGRPWREAP